MYFQLHGIGQQSLENKSPLKKLFYPFYRALIERPKIYTLSLRNYSYMGSLWSQRNKDNVCDIYFIQMHIYIYIYIYIIHLFHALNISAIPRNKAANLKKENKKQGKTSLKFGKELSMRTFPSCLLLFLLSNYFQGYCNLEYFVSISSPIHLWYIIVS